MDYPFLLKGEMGKKGRNYPFYLKGEMGKKGGNYPFCLKGEMGNVLGGVLPEGDVDDAEEHHKIDTIGGNLKVEIKEAVKGNGHQAA